MKFANYIDGVAAGVDVHNTREISISSKLGIDPTKKQRGEGHKHAWPPLIKMDESVRKKIDALHNK